MTWNIIHPSNIGGTWDGAWDPATFWGHHVVLAPMLAIHEGARIHRLRDAECDRFTWEWARTATTREALEVIWNMTGRWNARRPVTVARKLLDRSIATEVPQLAEYLNRNEIRSLLDVAQLEPARYQSALTHIHGAVNRISALRKTTHIEPVLGSKVLHHYFPSVVPVFDTRYIRNGVMKGSTYRDSFKSWEERRIFATADEAGGPSMLDYHDYLAFCAWQLGTARPRALAVTRARFGTAFKTFAPFSVVADRESILWRLDAKIVEYCAVNDAERPS